MLLFVFSYLVLLGILNDTLLKKLYWIGENKDVKTNIK